MRSHLLFLISILFIEVISSPVKQLILDETCERKCQPTDPSKINVHLIPHSHDDVGWLKTVDQYFYGTRPNIQQAGVQFIISSTVEALKENPDRTYVQVESAFFWKWWKDATESRRNDFKNLVNSGQIEMINGAWSMNDEACANYQSTVDQFTWGLGTINNTVGPCGIPRIGWQIDPFGHSREQASIFTQLGFDGVFFARLDYKDRELRKQTKTMDFLWQGSANLEALIFGNAFPESLYFPPSGFCWDVTCGDDPIIDDPESFENNVLSKVSDFTNKIKEYSTFYPTNNVLVPMGGDFQYQAAEFNFINMDKLIKAFADNDELNVIYSTPSCYIKAVNEANPELKLKVDDFFPYGSDDHSYWTGYFTSRPNSKRYERTSHNVLQATKQLYAINKLNGREDYSDNLRFLREAMGIMQHHDAITGTEKQHVVQDYVRLLTRGVDTAEENVSDVLKNVLSPDGAQTVSFKSCPLANISICETTSSDGYVVAVYNPLSRKVTQVVRLPAEDASYNVQGPEGAEDTDILEPISSFEYVKLDQKPSAKSLAFVAKDVPPFGVKLYQVTKAASKVVPKPAADDLTFGSETLGFTIDPNTNLLNSVTINGKTVEITQELMYYEGANGDNNGDNKASGAYIFRPLNGNSEAKKLTDTVSLTYNKGNLIDEVTQVYNSWATQIIRVYKGEGIENYIEFDWLVGPVDVDLETGIGKEVISRFTVKDFKNNGVFYTDSNGRELIKRTKDKRYDYDYDPTLEPISSNYYPVTSKILIRDDDQKLEVAVLNDRSQGGSSLHEGELELMVHRRLLKDDAKGVSEALNETEFDQGVVVRGTHYLILGSTDDNLENGKSLAATQRELALKKLLPLYVLVSGDVDKLDNYDLQASALTAALPDNVNILTFEPWNDDQYILRLEHIIEKDEDANLSQDVTVDLTALLTNGSIKDIKETTLGANQYLEDYNKNPKYEWKTAGRLQSSNINNHVDADPLQITLSPMQIRTFIVTFN